MVLDHIADRAGFFIIAAAPFYAERLGDSDLHVVDVRAVPQRLKQDVGETQRHEVLHGFLAEIVIDPENVALEKHRADNIVDRRRALAISPDRLLDNDARSRSHEAFHAKALRQRAEQVGPCCKIVGADAFIGAEQRLQVRPSAVLHRVDRNVVEPGQETLHGPVAFIVNASEFC